MLDLNCFIETASLKLLHYLNNQKKNCPATNQIDLSNEIEKRQFIAQPRVGRSIEQSSNSGQVKTIDSSIPKNKILTNLYSDLLKRQGYIPTARVGRSSSKSTESISNLLNRYSDLLLKLENALKDRSKDASASALDYENKNFLINNKRQFLPPPRIGRRSPTTIDSQLTKETLALNEPSLNSIEGTPNSGFDYNVLSNYLQDDLMDTPVELRKFLKWFNMNKNKLILANGLNEKRATFHSSRLGRSAPLTPRLGRSYWESEVDNDVDSNDNEHNDKYYESAINNRNIRTALTPRIGKRSLKTNEKVM